MSFPIGNFNVVQLVDAATVEVNSVLGDNFRLVLGGNRTLANPINLIAGEVMNFRFVQDATGGRSLAFGTKYKFPGGVVPTLTVTANAKDFMSCQYDPTDDTLFCVLSKGFA